MWGVRTGPTTSKQRVWRCAVGMYSKGERRMRSQTGMEKFLVKKMARSGGKSAEVRERRVVQDNVTLEKSIQYVRLGSSQQIWTGRWWKESDGQMSRRCPLFLSSLWTGDSTGVPITSAGQRRKSAFACICRPKNSQ